jgi:hypothetical protein
MPMANLRWVEWLFRIGLFGLFIGHGVPALEGNPEWVKWIMAFGGWDAPLATQFLFLIGILDIMVSLFLLFKPIRIVLLWAIIWTTWTAVMRVLPFINQDIWEFVERWINITASLAFLLIRGWPRSWRDWLR